MYHSANSGFDSFTPICVLPVCGCHGFSLFVHMCDLFFIIFIFYFVTVNMSDIHMDHLSVDPWVSLACYSVNSAILLILIRTATIDPFHYQLISLHKLFSQLIN